MDCIFCKIIEEEIPSKTIYEDELVKVFLDIEPLSTGHMLIIPKKHFKDLEDIDLQTLNHINEVSKKMHKLLKDKLNIDGMTTIQNNGEPEEVKHFHLHIKPFYKEDKTISIDEVYNILTRN